jgi:hypothetical protein
MERVTVAVNRIVDFRIGLDLVEELPWVRSEERG